MVRHGVMFAASRHAVFLSRRPVQGGGAIKARHDAVIGGFISARRVIHHIFLARFPRVRVHVAMGSRAKQYKRPFTRVGLYGVGQARAKPVLLGAVKTALGGDEAFVVDVPELAVFANVVFGGEIFGERGRVIIKVAHGLPPWLCGVGKIGLACYLVCVKNIFDVFYQIKKAHYAPFCEV